MLGEEPERNHWSGADGGQKRFQEPGLLRECKVYPAWCAWSEHVQVHTHTLREWLGFLSVEMQGCTDGKRQQPEGRVN